MLFRSMGFLQLLDICPIDLHLKQTTDLHSVTLCPPPHLWHLSSCPLYTTPNIDLPKYKEVGSWETEPLCLILIILAPVLTAGKALYVFPRPSSTSPYCERAAIIVASDIWAWPSPTLGTTVTTTLLTVSECSTFH